MLDIVHILSNIFKPTEKHSKLFKIGEDMSNNSLLPIAIIGVGIFAIITPILIAHMFGKEIKGYECGVHLGNKTVSPYCRCLF